MMFPFVVVFFLPATVDYQRSTKSKTRKVETNEATKQNQNDKALSQTPKSTRNHLPQSMVQFLAGLNVS